MHEAVAALEALRVQQAAQQSSAAGAVAPRILFANAHMDPTSDGGFAGLDLGARANIETAEQAVMAVRQAQARGHGLLPPEEHHPPTASEVKRWEQQQAACCCSEHCR